MNFVFFGTPEFAAIILEKLIKAGLPPQAVVCNPDKPVGRKQIITSPPVKVLAEKHGIKVLQPEKLEIRNLKLEISEIDFAVVAAYAKIIPKEVLDIPQLGSIGVHPSLLPKYRGSSPIQSAILAGEKETGVSLFLMDEMIDHGPILVKSEIRISKSETYESLHDKLAELGGDLLIEFLRKYENIQNYEKIESVPQNESQATLTKKFSAKGGSASGGKTEDAYIEPAELEKALNEGGEIAVEIERKIRALNPEPGVFTILTPENYHSLIRANRRIAKGKEKRMKILEAEIIDGKIKLKKIQMEGKKPIIIK
jgi:methionyl-tRNA formyltransferase